VGFAPEYAWYPAATATPGSPAAAAARAMRSWRRTRTGLLLSGLGLALLWIPWVLSLGALFLSLGSTFLFLGARAAGRRHFHAVLVAFLALAAGGVLIGAVLAAFVLEAMDAAYRNLRMEDLRPIAGVLVWGTLPGTLAIAAAVALQVQFLLPRRRRWFPTGLLILLALTAGAATWLSGGELEGLGPALVRMDPVLDLMNRLSLYRALEAPAYVGFAALYVSLYLAPEVRARALGLPSAPGA